MGACSQKIPGHDVFRKIGVKKRKANVDGARVHVPLSFFRIECFQRVANVSECSAVSAS